MSVATKQTKPLRGAAFKIVEWLRLHGPIEDPSGRTCSLLAAEIGAPSTACTQALYKLDKGGVIVRKVNGKRCTRIALAHQANDPATWRKGAAPSPPAAALEPLHDDRQTPDAEDECRFCTTLGQPCALHREAAPRPLHSVPAKPPLEQPAAAPPPRTATSRGTPPPVPAEAMRQALLDAAMLALRLQGEREDEIASLRGQLAEQIDETARLRQVTIDQAAEIGQLRRTNELLGNRLLARGA